MKRMWKIAFALCSILCAAIGWRSHQHNEMVLNSLLFQIHGKEAFPFRTIEEEKAWNQQYRAFCLAWSSRYEREVGADLMPYLEDKVMRWRVIRALGRVEYAPAEPRLLELTKNPQDIAGKGQSSGIDSIRNQPFYPYLPLAISRIQTRSLSANQRVNKLCASVGLSFSQVCQLSQRISSNPRMLNIDATDGGKIVAEVIDLLYSLRRKGINVDSYVGKLSLSAAQKVLLNGAKLPVDEEIRLILDYGMAIELPRLFDRTLVVEHLVGLSPRAGDALLERLKDMQKNRSRYTRTGCATICIAAAVANDSRAVPYLKQLESDSDVRVRFYAERARRDIEVNPVFPTFPA